MNKKKKQCRSRDLIGLSFSARTLYRYLRRSNDARLAARTRFAAVTMQYRYDLKNGKWAYSSLYVGNGLPSASPTSRSTPAYTQLVGGHRHILYRKCVKQYYAMMIVYCIYTPAAT